MKFSDFFDILNEQDDQMTWDDEPIDDEPEGGEPEDTESDDEDDESGDQEITPKPKKKKLKPLDIAKQRWKEEHPGLSDYEINQSIEFFNQRKGNLRPFKGTIDQPDPDNMPEVTSLKQRFPDFPADNVQRLKDVTQYSWDQLEFLNDRFTNADAEAEVEFEVRGDTKKDRWDNAMRIWKNFPRQVLNEGGIIVNRVEGVDESRALGNLQHILVGEYTGNKWCITLHPGDGNNLYNRYRSWGSYYFTLDTNKDKSDIDYVNVIMPVKHDRQNEFGEFVYSDRENWGNKLNKTWDDIVAKYPGLENHRNIFQFFGTTTKEDLGTALDNISMKQGSPNDLAVKPPRIQKLFIDSGRFINTPRVFLSLPKDLQSLYIAHTRLEDYKQRFRCDDVNNPFGMLDALNNKNMKFLHETVLKRQLGIVDGIYAIKASIIKFQYNMSFSIKGKESFKLFYNKHGEDKLYGILDLSNIKWVREIGYRRSKQKLIFIDGQLQFVFKFTRTNDDYFYMYLTKKALLSKDKEDPERFRGVYVSKEEGDNKFGRYFAR